MSKRFSKVAVVARKRRQHIVDSVLTVERCLEALDVDVIIEDATADLLPISATRQVQPRNYLASLVDLVVVVGGDGSLLGMSREIAPSGIPVVGVNRGGLGFLAAIPPERIEQDLTDVLAGKFSIEDHFLLAAQVCRHGAVVAESTALNDVVIHPGSVARMLEFELFVDDEYVYDQRSDGLIVASPTGSTAYSLSAGGPIMHPSLDAIVIVPMFPHTLTSRPLVVRGTANITVRMRCAINTLPSLSCDSQVNFPLEEGDEVRMAKYEMPLKLLYPTGHSFYESCRSKLDWASRLGGQQLHQD